jgi:hypothetical protein
MFRSVSNSEILFTIKVSVDRILVLAHSFSVGSMSSKTVFL